MTRRSDHEKETLRISADAAEKLLVKLGEERNRLDARIAGLQAVVHAYETLTGKHSRSDAEKEANKKRAPKGQVFGHVEEILRDNAELEEPAIRKAIQDKFGVSYGRATVYACLRRGARDHKFVPNGRKWGLNPMRAEQVTQ